MHELDKTMEAAREAYERWQDITFDQTPSAILNYIEALELALVATTSAGVTDGLVAAFRTPGTMVFLDGRNEHGSHVIPSLPSNLPDDAWNAEDGIPTMAEEIISAAEALGFAVGDHVWAEFHWNKPQRGDEGRVEFDGYWEFVRIDADVSRSLSNEEAPK